MFCYVTSSTTNIQSKMEISEKQTQELCFVCNNTAHKVITKNKFFLRKKILVNTTFKEVLSSACSLTSPDVSIREHTGNGRAVWPSHSQGLTMNGFPQGCSTTWIWRTDLVQVLTQMGKQWKQWQTWTPKSLKTVTAALKLKDASSLEEKLWQT